MIKSLTFRCRFRKIYDSCKLFFFIPAEPFYYSPDFNPLHKFFTLHEKLLMRTDSEGKTYFANSVQRACKRVSFLVLIRNET